MSGSRRQPLEPRAVEERLGYRFHDPALLHEALTHASSRSPGGPCNERLEFLGDSVIGLVVAHFLFSAYVELSEGELTRVRSAVVSAPSLARLAGELGLDRALRLGKGIPEGELPASVLANVVEAVVGAIYLDGGLDAARPLVLWGLADTIAHELTTPRSPNWKSILQEYTQQTARLTPTYEVIRQHGPHHQREFEVAALIGGHVRGHGQGPSKKVAEQAAARQALERVKEEGVPRPQQQAPSPPPAAPD